MVPGHTCMYFVTGLWDSQNGCNIFWTPKRVISRRVLTPLGFPRAFWDPFRTPKRIMGVPRVFGTPKTVVTSNPFWTPLGPLWHAQKPCGTIPLGLSLWDSKMRITPKGLSLWKPFGTPKSPLGPLRDSQKGYNPFGITLWDSPFGTPKGVKPLCIGPK